MTREGLGQMEGFEDLEGLRSRKVVATIVRRGASLGVSVAIRMLRVVTLLGFESAL
jgi:hypothetical protein